jgi:hypothetical protein
MPSSSGASPEPEMEKITRQWPMSCFIELAAVPNGKRPDSARKPRPAVAFGPPSTAQCFHFLSNH